MKIHELLEAGVVKGPGDYWAGDEYNPGSPDYNPRPTRISQSRGFSNDGDSEGDVTGRRITAALNAQKQYTRDGEVSTGDIDGKPYNLVITITGPAKGLSHQVDRFIDHETNIYHKFAKIDKHDNGDGTAAAKIYIQADNRSLLYHYWSTKV